MNRYKWSPLPDTKTWIRILSLQPGLPDEPLCGTLHSVEVEKASDYHATSYCVGPTDTPHELRLLMSSGTCQVRVTDSLFGMLKRFRSTTEVRRMWIDAICIDQTNSAEKGDQIMLMFALFHLDHEPFTNLVARAQIYTRTREAWIYLGESDQSILNATKLMDRIQVAMAQSLADVNLRPLDWQKENNIPLVTDPLAWEPMKVFFSQPWFIRKWTIQECVLPSQVKFHCGSWEADWDFMNTIITAIYSKGLAVLDHTSYSKVALRQQLQQGLAQLHSVANYRNAFLKHRIRYQLMDSLYVFQTSRATDLRDHLFALLGLACDSNDAALTPTYGSATIADNCLKYARFFLAKKNTLEVLYRAGLQGHKLLAPSWVPNWYGKQTDFSFEFAQGPWDPLRRPLFYNIARGSVVEFDLSPQSGMHRVLPIRGVVVDRVHTLTTGPSTLAHGQAQTLDAFLARKRQFNEECIAVASALPPREYPTGEQLQTALWKTLICGITLEHQTAADDVYSASYTAWTRCLRNDFRDLNDMRQCQRQQQLFRQTHDAFNGGKLMGSTHNGHLGMFSQSTRPGDLIVVFCGGEWPFVLREHPQPSDAIGDHELVGQCYIHGMMEEGQFDMTSKKGQEQWFKLGSDFDVEEPFQPNGQMVSSA
jgi:hypothetical protein